jgi:hypothetical protein
MGTGGTCGATTLTKKTAQQESSAQKKVCVFTNYESREEMEKRAANDSILAMFPSTMVSRG